LRPGYDLAGKRVLVVGLARTGVAVSLFAAAYGATVTATDEKPESALGETAARLRAEDPAAFGILARTPVTFAYSDATAELRASKPMIGVDPRGRIREVRFNHRSMQPLRPGRDRTVEETVAFYAAYRAFAEMVTRPDLMLTFRLAPGDCAVFDNTRILHARTGFAATGQRHLQGCYADLDGVASTMAVLRRKRRETG